MTATLTLPNHLTAISRRMCVHVHTHAHAHMHTTHASQLTDIIWKRYILMTPTDWEESWGP